MIPRLKWQEDGNVRYTCIEKNDRPLVHFSIAFLRGSGSDTHDQHGLSHLTAKALMRGSKKRSRSEIELELDSLAASLKVNVGSHSVMFDGDVLARNLDSLFDLVLELVSKPAFEAAEVDTLKTDIKAQLTTMLESDAQLGRQMFFRSVYGDHCYGRGHKGTFSSLENLGPDDCKTKHEELFSSNCILGCSGNITPAKTKDLAQRLHATLKSFPKQETLELPRVDDESYAPQTFHLIDKPDRTQTHFFLGHPSHSVGRKDSTAFKVFLNGFAGAMFQAEYMQEIRVKRGWSYGAYGMSDERILGGSFFLYTYPETKDTAEAIALSIEMAEKAAEKGIDEKLAAFSRKNLALSFPFEIETPSKHLDEKILNTIVGLPEDHLESFVERVQSTSLEEIQMAGKKWLKPEAFSCSILCSASSLEPTLRKQFPDWNIEVTAHDSMIK